MRPAHRTPFFEAFPARGPWTAVGLSRRQFGLILGGAVLLFLFVDGPVWRHLHEPHLRRIAVSYGAIPPATAFALRHNRTARASLVLGASLVIGLAKLLVTAALLLAIGMAG